MRHNNIRDFEANLLRIVHNDVEVEPQLQQVDNEKFNRLKEDNARPDVRAKGVWRNAQNAYFDLRVTNVKMLILTHRKICLLQKFFPSTSKIRTGIITGE